MTQSKPVTECQVCGESNLQSVLFLGYVPPVNSMRSVYEISTEETCFPLELLQCKNCALVQIGLEVEAATLFPETYPYLSGTTKILRENFANLKNEAEAFSSITDKSMIIDIGSNDGTLLSNFATAGYNVLGIEPSNAADIAMTRGIKTLKTFFSRESARKIRDEYGQAHLVTAANVFAHIGDIHGVVEGLDVLLADDGVFISESHYLLDLIETLQYDTIYHEHLRYYSLTSLKYLLEQHGLEVFHVTRIPTHGGSIRVFAARKGRRQVEGSVRACLNEELDRGIVDGKALLNFRERVVQSRCELYELVAPLKRAGARIFGVGAPSRASTLLSYVGFDDGFLDAVAEVRTSHKIGKFMPGTHLPVIDENELFEIQPEYALLLSWHITDELISNLRSKGFRGQFIVPLPTPRIIR